MNFTYPDVNVIELRPDDSMSFPAACGAKQGMLYFLLISIFGVIKKHFYPTKKRQEISDNNLRVWVTQSFNGYNDKVEVGI